MNVDQIISNLEKKHPGENEYLQAVREVLESIEEIYNENPQFKTAGIIERLVEPDRIFTFKVPWTDDEGNTHVNLGYRIQFNNAIGPYKGGLRFHPSVNLSILKFKLSQLNRTFGPHKGAEIYRDLVSAVRTDILCRGKLKHPEREFYKRVKTAIEGVGA